MHIISIWDLGSHPPKCTTIVISKMIKYFQAHTFLFNYSRVEAIFIAIAQWCITKEEDTTRACVCVYVCTDQPVKRDSGGKRRRQKAK